MKRSVLFLTVLILFFSFLPVYAQDDIKDAVGTVLEASEVIEIEENGFVTMVQHVKVRVDSGEYEGKTVDIENYMLENSPANIVVETGEKVILQLLPPYGEENFVISDYARTKPLIVLAILFCGLLIFIGGVKGIKSLLSLIITISSIFYIFIPLTVKGYNPLYLSVGIAVAVTFVSIFMISGVGKKSVAAIIGTVGGVIIAGILPLIISSKTHLTGLSLHEATMLLYIPQGLNFKITDILYSGIILGALGAIMDVGMSIASSMEEIYRANPSMGKVRLMKAGLNVGKDVMSTMTNTLILAYTGSSLPLLILFYAYDTSVIKIINLDVIATEIIRSLSGSIGIVLSIPLTVFVSAYLIYSDRKKIDMRGE